MQWVQLLVTGVLCRFGDRQGDERELEEPDVRAVLNAPAGDLVMWTHGPHDIVSGSVITTGMWDAGMMKRLHAAMHSYPDATFVDIGANIGVFALAMASEGYPVISVEGQSKNVALLQKSVRSNARCMDIQYVSQPVSNRAGTVVHYRKIENNNGATSMTVPTEPNGELGRDYGITTTLDAALAHVKDKKLVIKMDIEGAECMAIQGGRRLLSQNMVMLFAMELAPWTVDFAKTQGCDIWEQIQWLSTYMSCPNTRSIPPGYEFTCTRK